MNNNPVISISLLCTVVGIVIAYISYRQGTNKSIREDASEHTAVTAKLDYVIRGIDDIRLDVKDQGRRLDSTIERVTRVEESTKSAHKRLDDLGKDD